MILWKTVCRLFFVLTGLLMFSPQALAKPDLVIKSVTLTTTTPQQGQQIQACVVVTNSGSSNINASTSLYRYRVRVYLCASNTSSDVSTCLTSSSLGAGYISFPFSSHRAGRDLSTRFNFTIPSSTSTGARKLVFLADAEQ